VRAMSARVWFTAIMLLSAPVLVGAMWWSVGHRVWCVVTTVMVTLVLAVAAAVGMRLA
jgi:hypothetical protein